MFNSFKKSIAMHGLIFSGGVNVHDYWFWGVNNFCSGDGEIQESVVSLRNQWPNCLARAIFTALPTWGYHWTLKYSSMSRRLTICFFLNVLKTNCYAWFMTGTTHHPGIVNRPDRLLSNIGVLRKIPSAWTTIDYKTCAYLGKVKNKDIFHWFISGTSENQ